VEEEAMRQRHVLSLLMVMCALPLAAQAPRPEDSSAAGQPALTIYNQDFAVVRETIPLELKAGVSAVQFAGVTAHLEPESVMLRDCSQGRMPRILEQNYHPPISQQGMLGRYEGQTIEFLVRDGGQERVVPGKIIRAGSVFDLALRRRYGDNFYVTSYYNPQLSAEQQGLESPLVEVNGKLQFSLPGVPLFPPTADQTIFHPEIAWLLESDKGGSTRCELSYVSGGMTWEADYNVIAPAKGQGLELIGWVTLDNHSGKSFENARIRLMAGDVSKLQPGMPGYGGGVGGGPVGGLRSSGLPLVTEKGFDEYHLYTLERSGTLRDNETKQVEFLRRTGIQSRRVYVYSGFVFDTARQGYQPDYLVNQRWFGTTSSPKVWVMQEIKNTEAAGLGVPLPRGRLRFYRQDDNGQLEFVGENTIAHTPRDETFRVYTGNAFDLTGERRRTSYQVDNQRMWADESFEIKVRNHKKEAVDVIVLEHLYRGAAWEITSKSADFVKKDSQTIEFPLQIPAGEERTVIYSVHYTW
jgi:hypothetical protein